MEEESQILVSQIDNYFKKYEDWDVKNFNFDEPKSQLTSDIIINKSEVTKPPSFNELKSIAVDENGNFKKLNEEQLQQLRKKRQFSVPSLNLEGQEHLWQVNTLLQSGTDNIKESYLNGLASSCNQLIICIPDRVYRGKRFTLMQGLKSIKESFLNLPSILIGNREKIRPTKQEIKVKLEDFVATKMMEEIFNLEELKDKQHDQLIIKSKNGLLINISLINKSEIINLLRNPYNLFNKEWENTKVIRRQALYSKFKNEEVPEDLILKKVIDEENKMAQTKILELIKLNLPNEYSESMLNLFKAVGIIRKFVKQYQDKKQKALEKYDNELKKEHEILYRIPKWVQLKKDEYKKKWKKENPIDKMLEQISKELEGQEKYLFETYFNTKNSNVTKNFEKLIEEKTTPGRIFVFDFRIWDHKKWKIDHKQNSHKVTKYNRVSNSTTYPGWRMVNIGVRSAQYFNNGNYHLLSNMIMGPFGLRSLFGLEDFKADWNVNYISGEFESRKFTTWFGRIKKLWTNIKESIKSFEEKPDTGLLGKTFTRFFNRLWNYGAKGILGTCLIFIGHPLLVLFNTLIGIVGSLTSWIWAPLCAIMKYLFDILIYDLDATENQKFVWFPLIRNLIDSFLISGVGQSLCSILTIIFHALASASIFVGSSLLNGLRHGYDYLVYNLILKHKAKIPIDDGFLVRRIAGPGLSSDYFYLINYDFALVMVQYELESMEMESYKQQMIKKINLRRNDLLRGYEEFKKVALEPNYQKNPIKQFTTTKDLLEKRLSDIEQNYWDNHHVKGNINNRNNIKLTNTDLLISLESGAKLCSQFVPDKILNRLSKQEQDQFWNSKNLLPNDWKGLTTYCLKSAFSSSITVPIENTDQQGFHLQVKKIEVGNFIKDLFKGDPRDGLEIESINPITEETVMPMPDYELITPNNIFDNKSSDKYDKIFLLNKKYFKKENSDIYM